MALAEPRSRTTVIESGCLRIEVGPEIEACLIRLSGELDLASAPALQSEVDRLLAEALQTIVIDLANLEFIDSMGIQCLVQLSKRSRAGGDPLRFVDARGDVDRMLRLTGVRDALPVIEHDLPELFPASAVPANQRLSKLDAPRSGVS